MAKVDIDHIPTIEQFLIGYRSDYLGCAESIRQKSAERCQCICGDLGMVGIDPPRVSQESAGCRVRPSAEQSVAPARGRTKSDKLSTLLAMQNHREECGQCNYCALELCNT